MLVWYIKGHKDRRVKTAAKKRMSVNTQRPAVFDHRLTTSLISPLNRRSCCCWHTCYISQQCLLPHQSVTRLILQKNITGCAV